MPSLRSLAFSFVSRLHAVLYQLTRPHPRLPYMQRSRAQILSVLLLIYIPCIALVSNWAWLGAPLQALLFATPLVLILTYAVNQAGYFRTAAWMTILMLLVHPLVFLLTLHTYSFETINLGTLWLMTPLLGAFVLLELRDNAITMLLVIAAVIATLTLRPGITLGYMSVSLIIVMWVAVVMLVASIVHQQDARAHQARLVALQESEARYRTLFSAAAEGIMVHRDGLVVDCNPACAKLVGYTVEEARGKPALEFFAPEERERALDLMKSTELYQAEGVRKDGSRLWVEVHGLPMVLDGVEVRVATVSDITERRKAELQQVTIAVEKEKVAILQRFITNVSHDLRTPLSTINTGLYLIGKVKDDPARLEAQIASVQDQVAHLERLIDDLLSMSRLDRRRTGEYHFGWHDINELVGLVAEAHRAQAAQKMQTLRFHASDGLPLALLDEREFRRMLQNLLQNAITFTPKGGEVTLTTTQEGEEIVIAVNDTGIGISESDRGHIFDYFYRGDEARNPDTGGTGLGLTIAQRISEAHNGRIEVDSAPGKGSTFRVRLPITRRAAPLAAEAGWG